VTGSGQGEDSEKTVRVASGDPWLGRVLKNKYRLERLLGAGGFGAVYAARQLLMGTWHAVKLLHGPSGSQPELVDRFREEARIGTQLRHPRIVAVTDFDVEGATFFLVMDYIESVTLTQRLRESSGYVGEQVEPWARDIAAALDYAHAQRVIHRDLKPSNILIREQDQAALLTDFGISRWLSSVGVTQAGTTLGTYAYMSPQQCAGEERAIDSRSDIYSLAALLFELECGRPPFGTGQDAMHAHLYQPVPSVRRFRADHPAADQLDAVFARGLAKSPNQRPQSAEELVETFLLARAGVTMPSPSPPEPPPAPEPPPPVPEPPLPATPVPLPATPVPAPSAPAPPLSPSPAPPPSPVVVAAAADETSMAPSGPLVPPHADSLRAPAAPGRKPRVSAATQLPLGVKVAAIGTIGLLVSFFVPLTAFGAYPTRSLVEVVIDVLGLSSGSVLLSVVLVALACFVGWQSMVTKRGRVALVLAISVYLLAGLAITLTSFLDLLIPMAIILAAIAIFLSRRGTGVRIWIGLLLAALFGIRQMLLVIGSLDQDRGLWAGFYFMGASTLALLVGAVIEIRESRRHPRGDKDATAPDLG
jgi:serine/threonine protein kinase